MIFLSDHKYSKWIHNYENVGKVAIIKVYYSRINKEERKKEYQTKTVLYNYKIKILFLCRCPHSLPIEVKLVEH